jgi:hypothetical protein
MIPFDSQGDPLFYYANYMDRSRYTWKENYEWFDYIQIRGFNRGRSAANFSALGLGTGLKYTLFMTDLLAALTKAGAKPGELGPVLEGTWTFCKRGANFGVKLV